MTPYADLATHMRRLVLAKEDGKVPKCANVANVTIVQSLQENNAPVPKNYERWVGEGHTKGIPSGNKGKLNTEQLADAASHLTFNMEQVAEFYKRLYPGVTVLLVPGDHYVFNAKQQDVWDHMDLKEPFWGKPSATTASRQKRKRGQSPVTARKKRKVTKGFGAYPTSGMGKGKNTRRNPNRLTQHWAK